MTLRVLVVDDEPPARERLRQLCGDLPDVEVVGEAANGREALEATGRLAPDLVLLDVRMPGMDGLEAAQQLAQLPTPPAVVFVTAYDHYAMEAFDAAAAAYLLKPVRREKLAAALARAQRPTRAQQSALGALAAAAPAAGHLTVRHLGQLRLVPLASVLACVADQKYVTLHTREGDFLTEESLKSLEDSYPALLLRVHRNALVAPAHVLSVGRETDGGLRLQLRDHPLVLEASRRQAPEVLRRLTGTAGSAGAALGAGESPFPLTDGLGD
jgi:two-component system response regulator AlgR